eukprot:Hpha_TRINITY_DN16660_c1_g1::TRINITY_DN16660_c1_g1_i7::g.181735::m.181735
MLNDVFHFDSSSVTSTVYGLDGKIAVGTPLELTSAAGALNFVESPFAAIQGSLSAVQTNGAVHSVVLRTSPSYFTLSAWVLPSSSCVAAAACPVFARLDGAGSGILLEAATGTLSFSVSTGQGSVSVTAGTSLVEGKWTFVTIRSAPQMLTLCVDDACDSTAGSVPDMSSSSLPLSVAGRVGLALPLTVDELYISPRTESDEAIHTRYISYAAANPSVVLSIAGPDVIGEGHQLTLTVSANTGLEQEYYFSWSIVGAVTAAADWDTPYFGKGASSVKVSSDVFVPGRTYTFRVCARVGHEPVCATKLVDVTEPLLLSGVSAVCSSGDLCHGESAGVSMLSPWCLSLGAVTFPSTSAGAEVRYAYSKPLDSEWQVGEEQALTAGYWPLESGRTLCGVLLPAAPGGLTIIAEVRTPSGASAVARTTVYVSHSTVDCSTALTSQSSAEQRLITAAACGTSTQVVTSASRAASALAAGGLLETYVTAAEELRGAGRLPPASQIASDLAVLTDKAPPSSIALLNRTVALLVDALAAWKPAEDTRPQRLRESTLRTVSNLQYAVDSMSSPRAAHEAVDALFAAYVAAEASSMIPLEAAYRTPAGHAGVHSGAAVQVSVSQRRLSTEIDVHCPAASCPKAYLRFGSGAFPTGSSQAAVTLTSREDNPYGSDEHKPMAGVVTVHVTHDQGGVPAKAGAGHEVVLRCTHCTVADSQNFKCVQLQEGTWQEAGITTLKVGDGEIRCGAAALPVSLSAVYAGSNEWVEPTLPPTPEPAPIATPAPPTGTDENRTSSPTSSVITRTPEAAVKTAAPTVASSRVVRVQLSTSVSTFNAQALVRAIDNICREVAVSANLVRRCPVVNGVVQWHLCAAELQATRRAEQTEEAHTLADLMLSGPTPAAVDECIVLARIEVEKGAAGGSSSVPNVATDSTLVVDPVVGSPATPAPKTTTSTPAKLPVDVEDANTSRGLVIGLAAAAVVLLLMVAGAAYYVFVRSPKDYENVDREREMRQLGGGAGAGPRAEASPRSNAELRTGSTPHPTTTFGGVAP